MEISMFVEGHGYGHASRMHRLAKNLNANVVTFGDAARFFEELNYPIIEIEKPYSLIFNDEEFDLTKSFSEMIKLFDVSVVKKVAKEFENSDIVIVDSSLFGFVVAKFIGKKVIYISNSTDVSVFFKGKKAGIIRKSVNSLLSRSDKVLVCDFPPPYTISKKNIMLDLNVEFIGPLVSVEDIKKGKKEYGVISFGSSNFEGLFRIVDRVDYPFVSSYYSGVNITRVRNARDYLGRANFVISHGGHSTIMESILLGLPLILIPEKSYAERLNNSLGVVENSLGVMLDEDYVSPLVIEKAIDDALNLKNHSKRFSRWAKKFNAFDRVKEAINELSP